MSIARQAAQGVAWNMLLGVGARVLQLVGTLILTRIIAPDDYGEVIAASILVMTSGLLTSFAFGQYMIAKRVPPDVAGQAGMVHLGLGVAAMIIIYTFRYPLGEYFGTPDTGDYVLPFAIAHLIDRSRYVPERLLLRALQFRTVAAINATGELAFTITALSLAKSWGTGAIVAGWLVRSSLQAALYFRSSPRGEWTLRTRLRAAEVKNLFSYGLPIMIGGVSDHLATRFDNLIVSKLFGPAVMGRYNLSYSLAEMPVNSIASQIGDVLMPSFSKMEDSARRGAVVRAAALMSLVVSPLGVGLAAVSQTLVATFFNDEWGPAMAPMLAILSVMSVFRPMTWSAVAYLQAVQKTRLIMYSSFFRAIAVLSLVATLGYFGDEDWACVGAAIGFLLHAVFTILAAGRVAGFSGAAYLAGVVRPLVPCVPMYFAVIGLQGVLTEAAVPRVLSLVTQISAGAIVYVIAAFALCRPAVRELVRFGRTAVRRRR